ncbi:MAG: NAD-dependent epimerase/dehydratase family protein, partial [Alphaproteobacteria bacterium]|nr:NAD-dependent epimerase/dehydratase family protein [Alphaproteobacteria bacterium]
MSAMLENILPSDIEEMGRLLGDVAHDFEGKTVLLSGAAGFLGRYFVALFEHMNKKILKKPCKLIAMDIFITQVSPDWTYQDSEHFTFFRHDIIEKVKVAGPIDYIVHASGIASPFYYRKYPLETLDVAITGTRNFLDIAREKGSRFTFFSSSE